MITENIAAACKLLDDYGYYESSDFLLNFSMTKETMQKTAQFLPGLGLQLTRDTIPAIINVAVNRLMQNGQFLKLPYQTQRILMGITGRDDITGPLFNQGVPLDISKDSEQAYEAMLTGNPSQFDPTFRSKGMKDLTPVEQKIDIARLEREIGPKTLATILNYGANALRNLFGW
jgi:hypothetical protein